MPIENQDLRALIEERIEDEKRVVKLLRDSMAKTGNMVIRLMLNKLAFESLKHENVLRTILRLLESPSEEKFEKEGEEFQRVLERHVEIEWRMMEALEGIIDKTEDKHIRFLLQDMISDERRHHAVMMRAYELACEGVRVRDERWWDFLFRYSSLTG